MELALRKEERLSNGLSGLNLCDSSSFYIILFYFLLFYFILFYYYFYSSMIASVREAIGVSWALASSLVVVSSLNAWPSASIRLQIEWGLFLTSSSTTQTVLATCHPGRSSLLRPPRTQATWRWTTSSRLCQKSKWSSSVFEPSNC